MKPCELQAILSREWHQYGQHIPVVISPQARFVTGSLKRDSQLHRVVVEYGIELDVDTRLNSIEDYRVVDEKKYAWFLLRWG